MTIRFNKILRSCSSLVLHVSDLIDQFRNSTSLFVIYNEHAQHPHKIQTNQSQLLYRHLPIMQSVPFVLYLIFPLYGTIKTSK